MFNEATITKSGNKYKVAHGDDSTVFAQFYWMAIEDEEKTKAQGRPIYKNKEMVRISFAGNNTKIVDRAVRHEPTNTSPSDTDRFHRQWEAFQNQQKQVPDGVPLEHWAALNKAQVMELKALNIHTVEQMANLSDHHLKMGMRQIRDKASAWLEEADAGTRVLAQQTEIEDLKKEIEAMKNQFRGLKSENPSKKADNDVIIVEAPPVQEAFDTQPIKRKMRKKALDRVDNGKNVSSDDAAGSQ